MVERYVHLASQIAAVRSQGFSPLDRFDVQGARRFRHGFNPDKVKGKIYPNAGRSSRDRGSWAKQPGSKR